MDQDFRPVENISSMDLALKIIGWRSILFWVTIISAAMGITLCLLIPKQYLSTTTMFPSRQFSVSKMSVTANEGNQGDYLLLGFADDCERLMQALNTDGLKLRVADHLDLWTRWKIKKDDARIINLRKKWEKMITVKRTEFHSVRLDVYDYTANHAAQLANAIPQFADTVKFHMTTEMAKNVVKIVKDEYDATLYRMKIMQDTLATLRQVGVMHFKEMVKALMNKYADAISDGDMAAAKRLESKLDTLRKYGMAYEIAKSNLDMYYAKYPDIRMKYDEALVDAKNQLPMKFLIEKAAPDEFKAKPKRMVIFLLCVLIPNFLAILGLLLRDRMRKSKGSSFVSA